MKESKQLEAAGSHKTLQKPEELQVSEAVKGPWCTLNHKTVKGTVNIISVTAGGYYKAMKSFFQQIMQAVSKKTKGNVCIL